MIEVDDGEGIRTILLDRPTRRNALTPDGLEALESAVAETPHSVIFLEGAGPAFCAGADLDVVAGLDRDGAEAFARLGQRVANAIADSDAVVVAGIDGPARGGGLELALACDIRVGTPEATLGEPGVTFGLFGAWGGTVRLPRIVGEGVALELACTGRVLEAEEALQAGLLSRLEDEPRTVAETIVEYPTDTLAVLQSRIRDRADRATQEEREALAFGALVESHGEAIARRFG